MPLKLPYGPHSDNFISKTVMLLEKWNNSYLDYEKSLMFIFL